MNVLNLNMEFCFTCLKVGAEGDKFVSIEFAPPDELSYKSKLRACVPEMAINNMEDRYLCKPCAAALETAYTFRCMCLRTETRLEELQSTQMRLANAREKAVKAETILSTASVICINSDIVPNSLTNVPDILQEIEPYTNTLPATELDPMTEDSKIEIVKEELGNLLSESVGSAIDINTQIYDNSESCNTEINSDINIFSSVYSDCQSLMNAKEFLKSGTNGEQRLNDNEIIERCCQTIPALRGCTPGALKCTVSVEKIIVTSQPVKVKEANITRAKTVQKKNHWCEVCNKNVRRKDRLIAHILKHSDIRGYKCNICSKRFYSSDSLYNHTKTHKKEKKSNSNRLNIPNNTTLSSSGTKNPNAYSAKFLLSENNSRSKIVKNYKLNSQLKNAKVKTSKEIVGAQKVKRKRCLLTERYYHCKLCGYHSLYKQKYRVHLLRHAKDKRFACSECSQAFYENWELRRHKRMRHKNSSQISLNRQNESATNIFEEKQTEPLVSDHQKNVTTEPSSRSKKNGITPQKTGQICNTKSNQISLEKNLTKHRTSNPTMKKVKKKKKYFCDVCNLEFASKDHANVHTGDKPYPCKICSKMFAAYNTAKRHLKTHMKNQKTLTKVNPSQKMYICDICTKSFRTKDHLHSHSCRNASGDLVYRCQICKNAFVGRISLIEHMRVHVQGDSATLEMVTPTFTN